MDRPRDDDVNDPEQRLRGWRPASSGIDRDRTLFLAGRASALAETRARIVAASFAVIALAMGGLYLSEHARRVSLEGRIAEARREVPSLPVVVVEAPRPLAPESYLVLTRRSNESESLDFLPESSKPSPIGPPTDREPPFRVRGWADWKGL